MGRESGLAGVSTTLPSLVENVFTVASLVGDAGHHDVTLLRVGLLADHDEVALDDAGVDHRVALDPQHEQRAGAGEVLGQRVELLDVLLGQDTGAGGHVADQGHVADRPGVHDHLGRRVVADLDGPGLGRVAAQVALALEHGQVGVDGRGGGEADRLADLAHRRRVAAVADRLGDAVEDLLPLGAQYLGHESPSLSGSAALSHPRANVCLHERSPGRRAEANICSKKSLTSNRCSWWDGAMTNTGSRDRSGRTSVRRCHNRHVQRPRHRYNESATRTDDRKELPMTALLTAPLPEYLDDEPFRTGPTELRLVQAPDRPWPPGSAGVRRRRTDWSTGSGRLAGGASPSKSGAAGPCSR